MKAVICTKYGPPEVLEIREVAKPKPKGNEVLVKIYATTAHVGDGRIRRFDVPRGGRIFARLFLGLIKPRKPILGMELSGEIEAVGKKVTRFQVGDDVFASTGFKFGTYAEYRCLPEKGIIALKPTNMTFAEAAALPTGAMTALAVLRKAKLKPGQTIMVYGASGSTGSYAIQLAKYFGTKVTGVCSTTNREMVRSLGADQVIDYTKEDLNNLDQKYDVVFDAVGKLSPSVAKKMVQPGGIYLNVNKDSGSYSGDKLKDLNFLKELVETGKLRAFIDRSYSIDQIIDAHHYLDQGHKRGNVVVTVFDEDTN